MCVYIYCVSLYVCVYIYTHILSPHPLHQPTAGIITAKTGRGGGMSSPIPLLCSFLVSRELHDGMDVRVVFSIHGFPCPYMVSLAMAFSVHGWFLFMESFRYPWFSYQWVVFFIHEILSLSMDSLHCRWMVLNLIRGSFFNPWMACLTHVFS